MRAYFTEQDGKQPGDPQKAVEAIVKAVESEHPPLHLLLGASTIPRVKAKIEALQKDLAEWEIDHDWADYRRVSEGRWRVDRRWDARNSGRTAKGLKRRG
jgi:hypothetical protein